VGKILTNWSPVVKFVRFSPRQSFAPYSINISNDEALPFYLFLITLTSFASTCRKRLSFLSLSVCLFHLIFITHFFCEQKSLREPQDNVKFTINLNTLFKHTYICCLITHSFIYIWFKFGSVLLLYILYKLFYF